MLQVVFSSYELYGWSGIMDDWVVEGSVRANYENNFVSHVDQGLELLEQLWEQWVEQPGSSFGPSVVLPLGPFF